MEEKFKTIKELEAEKGRHTNHPLDKRNFHVKILRGMLGLIDEINKDPKGCLKSCGCVFCKLKARING